MLTSSSLSPSPEEESRYNEIAAANYALVLTRYCFAMRMPWLVDLTDFEPTEQEAQAFELHYPVRIPSTAALFADARTNVSDLGNLIMHAYNPIGKLLVERGVILVGVGANSYIRGRAQDTEFAQDLAAVSTTENLDLVLPSERLFADIHFRAGREANLRNRACKPLLDFIAQQRSAGQAEASQLAC